MFFSKNYAPIGSRPGTLVISKDAVPSRVRAMIYCTETLQEIELENTELATLKNFIDEPSKVVWVDVQGLGDEMVLITLGKMFGLHGLTLADVVNVPQRAKTEMHDNYFVNIGSMMSPGSDGKVLVEQLSVICGDNFVVTFQERPGDILGVVRDRLRSGLGAIRSSKSDYLAYVIIDTTIDALYPILETVGESLEELEDRIIVSPTPELLERVYKTKRELLRIRRTVWPQRESISGLLREESAFVRSSTKVYLRDTYEHIIQIIDVLETYREVAGSFMDIYLSSISNKMNEVMKVLTIMGTIFIPLSFLAGVFGMNFEHMPELKWKYAYPVFWVVILSTAVGMLAVFRKIGWLGSRSLGASEK